MASIRKRGDRWQVRYRDAAGRQRSRTVTTERDARVLKARLELDAERGHLADHALAALDFGSYAAAWLDGRRNLRPNSRRAYRTAINRLSPIGPIPLGMLTPSRLNILVSDLERDLSPATLQLTLAVLQMVLEAAVRDRAVESNPMALVERPAAPRGRQVRMRALTPAEVDKLAVVADEVREMGLLVRTLAYTGLRWGEAVALDGRHVDTAARRLLVERAWHEQDSSFGPPKSGRVRRVPLAEALAAELAGIPPHRAVFLAPQGGRLRRSAFTPVWRTITRKADMEGVRIHDLRHTCATWLIAKGMDPVSVASWLGHANANITLSVYAHVWPDNLDQAAGIMDDLWRGGGNGTDL